MAFFDRNLKLTNLILKTFQTGEADGFLDRINRIYRIFQTGGQDLQEITGWAEGVWTEFTELIELGFDRMTG